MTKFIVDVWLDGYEDEAEMEEACVDFIEEQLDMSASSASVEKYKEPEVSIDLYKKRLESLISYYKRLLKSQLRHLLSL